VNFPTHPQAAKTSDLLATLQAKLKSNQFFIAGPPAFRKLAPLPVKSQRNCQLAVEAKEPGRSCIGRSHVKDESDHASFLDDFSELLNTDRPRRDRPLFENCRSWLNSPSEPTPP
jgi:hypothetical protein